MPGCRSHGNDADLIPSFGMGDYNNGAFEKAKSDEARFSIVETIIQLSRAPLLGRRLQRKLAVHAT
jgi:hypothetical protein